MNESTINPLSARWLTILRAAPVSSAAPVAVELPHSLHAAFGQHRVWIIACLQAIDAVRRGVPVVFDHPIPRLSLPAPASIGSDVANAVWLAYLQYCLGSSEAQAWLTDAVSSLNPTALTAGIDDNPEPWWANELLILHALQSFVFRNGDEQLQMQIDRCVDFHVAEIQPDHATNEPWAIHAFARHPEGTLTAETLLHAAMVQGGGALTDTARLIVADAVHTLAAASNRG